MLSFMNANYQIPTIARRLQFPFSRIWYTILDFNLQSSSSSCNSLSRLASSCLISSASLRSLSLRASLSSCVVEADSELCWDKLESDGSMFVSCAAAGFRIDEIGLGRCGAGVVGFSSISSVALKLRFRGE